MSENQQVQAPTFTLGESLTEIARVLAKELNLQYAESGLIVDDAGNRYGDSITKMASAMESLGWITTTPASSVNWHNLKMSETSNEQLLAVLRFKLNA